MSKTIPSGKVLSIFFDMTGETDAAEWLEFCKASCRIIGSGLKEDVDMDENMGLLSYAAASHAFYMYVLRSCASGIASFKAVDISVQNTSELTLSAAKTIFEGAMASIAHLLKGTRFSFKAF